MIYRCIEFRFSQHGLFRRGSRENATAIPSSKINNSGGVNERMQY